MTCQISHMSNNLYVTKFSQDSFHSRPQKKKNIEKCRYATSLLLDARKERLEYSKVVLVPEFVWEENRSGIELLVCLQRKTL